MQSVQHDQEFPPPPIGEDHPVLRGLAADQAAAYVEEVRALRHRVAVLEAALAAAEATRSNENTSVQKAPPVTSIDFERRAAPATSQFTAPVAPAVTAAVLAPADSPAPVAPAPAPPAGQEESDVRFADAWTDADDVVSFEERIAAKAFFQAGSVDNQSRNWLLDGQQ